MFKYIKWISLIMLFVLIMVIGVKFIDYNVNDINKDKEDAFEKEDELEILYNRVWNKIDTSTYKSDGTAYGMEGMYEEYYMILTADYARYCKISTLECVDYEYTYKDGVIIINSEDYFLPNGSYNITFSESYIELTQEIGGDKTIHRFSVAEG